jgi:hypothetical protein
VGASGGGGKLAVLPSNKNVAVQMLAVVQEEATKRSAAVAHRLAVVDHSLARRWPAGVVM